MSNPAYTSPTYLGAPITGKQLADTAPNAVRQLWKKGADMFETEGDFMAQFEGGPGALIETETDTSKGHGQKITFTVKSGFYQEPHQGEQLFNTSADYEELKISTNELLVEWFRNGTRYTQRTEHAMGMLGEITSGLPEMLGELSGRQKSERMMMLFRDVAPAENKYTIDKTLGYNSIVTNAQQMKRWGAAPALVGYTGEGKYKQPNKRYLVLMPEDAATGLKLDGDYKDAIRRSFDPKAAALPFRGGLADIDGHSIVTFGGIEHDGYGAIGSPMNPLGKLANARTTVSTSTINLVTMGGSDYDSTNILIKPSKFFPGYAYPMQYGLTLTPDTTTPRYIVIINPANAATDPGKYGFYQIGPVTDGSTTVLMNDGVSVAIKSALCASAAAASGSSFGASKVTRLGSVDWDPNKHTNNHPVEALIAEVGSDSVPEYTSFIMGAGCARRGYGAYRNERDEDTLEGGFIQTRFVKSVFGQAMRVNRKGRAPGLIAIRHKGILAGTPLPTP